MKKRTSNVSRRIVSLLMSMVLTLTLVTPAAFATEVVGGSGTAIIEGNANPADANPNEDTEGKDDVDKNAEDEQQPAEPDDEDKEPSEDDEIIADEEDADDGDIYDVQEDTLLGISLYAAAASWDGVSTVAVEPNAEGIYEISTGAQLAWLAQQVVEEFCEFEDTQFRLIEDVDLGDKSWTPIGGDDAPFNGVFDGNGHTIRGLNVPDAASPGLFGNLGKNGTIRNLIVRGVVTGGTQAGYGAMATGGICSVSEGKIQNCGFYGEVTTTDEDAGLLGVGAIVGYGDGSADNSWYYCTGTSNEVGVVGEDSTASNCYTNVNTEQAGVTVVTAEQFKGTATVGDTGKTVTELLNDTLPDDDCMNWLQGVDYPLFIKPVIKWDGTTTEEVKPNTKGIYEISTGAQLAWLAAQVNNKNVFSGETVMLTADIDLGKQEWTPIGRDFRMNRKSFQGTFDGNGHIVTGLKISSGNADNVGLFGPISKAIVKNLIVEGNVNMPNGTTIGGIVADNSGGTVQNCGFYGVVEGWRSVGGVVGSGNAVNCWYYYTGMDEGYSRSVCSGTATKCYTNVNAEQSGVTVVTAEQFKGTGEAESLVSLLNKNVPDNCMNWAQGTDYPVFATGGTEQKDKTIRLIPLFPDCEFVASVEGEGVTYDVAKNIYTIGADTSVVKLTRSDGKPELWVTTKEDGTEASAVSSSEDFPISGTKTTLYYGTKDDFDTIAVWNSALNGNTATVATADQLKALARMVNSGKDEMTGKTISLDADIGLNSELWTPIGKTDHSFKGTFNGRNGSTYYTISGLNGDLFGVVNGIIQYVTVSGGTGRLVNTLKSGTVEKCMSTAEVTDSAGGLVGQNSGTVNSCYYYNAKSKNTPAVPAVVGSGKVTKCFYLADTSTFGAGSDPGARTAEEFQLGRVAYELGGSSYVWVYDTTKAEKMPQLGNASTSLTMAVASELKLTKPKKLPEGVKVTLGNDSDKKALTDAAGNQYYYAASAYPEGVSDVPVTFTAPTGYQIVFAPAATQVGGKDYLRITGSNVEYTYSLVKADIRWYESAGAEKNYVLKSADELMGFCLLANGSIDGVSKNFNGWTLSLGNNIDLENSEWKPIPRFAGAFDGKGYEITGLNVNYTGGDFNSKTAGMFEKLVSPGQILNLAVSGSVQAADKLNYVGGIVGTTESGSEIRFCRSNIAVKVDAENSTTNGMAYGGVAGKVQGAISNCLNEGTITVDNIKNKCYIGGVAGQVGSAADLCWNTGSVTASSTANKNIYTGGIVGYGAATNCYNNGSVTGATGKNKYVTGGISGNGNVTNSYNLGAVSGQGAAGITGKGTVTNSYYVCKLNDTDKKAYVNTTETPVTLGADGKTYMAGEKKLVDVLNDKHGTNELWFTNPEKNVYLPHHATKWDGETDTDCTFKTITVTYDPNGGVNKDGSSTPVTVSEMVYVVGEDVITPAKHIVLAADAENLGFKHENGTFNSWKDSNGTKHTAGDIITGITTGITLYAQWDKIWDGDGSNSDPYQISDAEKLTALQTQVNENGFSYTGKWFRLTNNIDLNNELWTPIGVDALHSFGGSLDGNGMTISGLKVETDRQWAGLFGSVRGTYGVPMTMRDLTLKNGSVKFTSSGTSCSGGLVAAVEGETALELRNVVAENLTVSGGRDGSGGLLGRGRVAMTNCHNRGGSVTGSYAGGLAGMGYSNLQDHVLAGCTNSAKVVGKRTAGGMTGNETYSDGSYTSCANSGSISATQGYASGIAAGGSYERCSNSGAVTGKQAAGITSNGNKATFCSNTGAIKGTDFAAGILTNGGVTEFCWNTGKVEASTPVKAFGILCGWGAYNQVRNSFSYVPGANIGLAPTELKEKNVSDSYYLADKKDSVSSVGEWASADDFASGKVAWGVDGGVNAHKNYWTQGANNYPVPIGEGTSTSYYRAKAECGTGGSVSIKSSRNFAGDADNAVYGPKGMSVTVTATPKDNTFGLKSLTLDLMGTGSTTALESGDSFTLGEANALVVATFASTGNGGSGGGSGSGSGAGTGDENDEGLQDGMNMDVEYNIKGLVLSTYTEWGSNGGKTFSQWLKDSPNVLRALIANSLDNMAAAAAAKKTDEASALAQALLASLNEHSGVAGKDGDAISKALQRFMTSGTEATFSTWLATSSGMASGTLESIFTQYTDSLLALADRLYTKWESSGTSMTFPAWLDAQQVSMENLSETAEEPDTDTTDESQTTEAPEDVPDGQESEGQVSGNSIWEIIGTAVRENPIIVWSIVAVVAALVIVGAVRRYHKVKRDERDDNGAE